MLLGDAIAYKDLQKLQTLQSCSNKACVPKQCSTEKNSSKTEEILKAVRNVHEASGGSEKIVIFSNFLKYLRILQDALSTSGYSCARIDGSMGHTERSRELDRFSNDPNIIIILCSVKACGTGVSLTAANHVFLADLWWSPAVDLQAIDRVHRLGQLRQVKVLRLLCQETLEEKIYSMQQEKSELSRRTFERHVENAAEIRRRNMERLLN